jgi:hypothetical protein
MVSDCAVKVIQKDPSVRRRLLDGGWKGFFAALDTDGDGRCISLGSVFSVALLVASLHCHLRVG